MARPQEVLRLAKARAAARNERCRHAADAGSRQLEFQAILAMTFYSAAFGG